MPKKIELTLAGTTASAVLHENAAPKTVQRLWDALPIEETLRHVRWSGSAGYIMAAALRDPSFPLENRVSFYQPGALHLKPEHGEVAISYGPAQAREPTGIGWATHFRHARRRCERLSHRGRAHPARREEAIDDQAEGLMTDGPADPD